MPKPVQRPHPELMIGGGGEKVTLKIARACTPTTGTSGAARRSSPTRGAILDEHCAAVGRDPRTLTRSANVILALDDDPEVGDAAVRRLMERMGRTEAAARDIVLAGPVAAVQDKLARLRETGVGTVFVFAAPGFLPPDPRPTLDRFIGEVAPALR